MPYMRGAGPNRNDGSDGESMTREQARAILQNIDLIRHYADGGDVGNRIIDYKGMM